MKASLNLSSLSTAQYHLTEFVMASNIGKNPEVDEIPDYEAFLKSTGNDLSRAALAVLPRKVLYKLVQDFALTINQMLTSTGKDEIVARMDPELKNDCEKVTSVYIKALAGSPLRGDNHPAKVVNQVLNFWNAYLDEVRKRNHLTSPFEVTMRSQTIKSVS